MKRPTIADIARRAGVTKAAVSFALNGQPGVSAATRERILAIAQEIGFQPNSAARALSDGRAGAFGLCVAPYRPRGQAITVRPRQRYRAPRDWRSSVAGLGVRRGV